LLAVKSVETEDGTTTSKTLRETKEGWELVTQTGERVEKRTVPAPKPNLAQEIELDRWLVSNPEKGSTRKVWMIDFDKKGVNEEETVEFLGTERRFQSGVAETVYLAKMKMDGVNATVKLLNQKVFLEASVGELIRMVAEEERIARRMDTKIDDLTHHLSVEIERDMGDDPGEIEQVTAEISGLGDFALPQSHRQRLEPRDGQPALLHLSRDHRLPEAAPLSEEDRKLWSEAQPGIESDHRKIRKRARAIVRGEKDAVRQAALLQHWVYENLKATSAKNSDSALTILSQKAGDCTEHARLFVAFARSVGLPAREVCGLLYVKFGKPLFGWHAWAEIHDGHQWVSVDPAWDQVFVDATHIRFGTGPDDLGWISAIGTLELQVTEFEKR
jgi:transglutaminase-like putative cysteine protease